MLKFRKWCQNNNKLLTETYLAQLQQNDVRPLNGLSLLLSLCNRKVVKIKNYQTQVVIN